MFTLSKKEKVLISFVLLAVMSRLLPHPPNFAPITAVSLFAGIHFAKKQYAFLIPMAAMILSDLFLGFYTISIFIYLAFLMITWIGQRSKKITPKLVLTGSVTFFIISNLGVWLLYYPLTIARPSHMLYACHSFFCNLIAWRCVLQLGSYCWIRFCKKTITNRLIIF